MKMQPMIAGETWTNLTSALVRLDDGDAYPSHLPYTIEDAQDPADAPLLRAILRVEAELLLAEADRVRPDRGLVPPDPDQLQGEACEELIRRLRAAFILWSCSAWFEAMPPEDRSAAARLAADAEMITMRIAARDAEVRAWVESVRTGASV